MTLPTYYNTGTVSVTNGGTTVTGIGTAWVAFLKGDDRFNLDGYMVRVASVTDNTHFELARGWPGTTRSGVAYEVAFTPDGSAMSGSVRSLLEALITGNIAALTLADGAAATPALRFLLEPGTGLWRNGAGKLAASVLGVKVAELSATGLALVSAGLSTSGAMSAAAWTTAGLRLKLAAATLTDTSSSGSVANVFGDRFGAVTFAASSATTYGGGYGVYFDDPVAGSNVTLSIKYALGADSVRVLGVLNGVGHVWLNTSGDISLSSSTPELSVSGGSGSNTAASFKTTAAATEVIDVWNSATSGDNLLMAFWTDGGTVRGTIDYNRGGGAVRYNTTSSATLKTAIVDLPDARHAELSSVVDDVQLREFEWRDAPGVKTFGVVTEELATVYPDALNGDGTQYDRSMFIFPLLAKCKELETRVADLTARLAAANL